VEGRSSTYEKLRLRGSIDFPLLSVAVSVARDGERIASAKIVVSALAAKPRVVRAAEQATGQVPDDELLDRLARGAYKECVPLANVTGEVAYRRDMVPVLVRRALVRALG
jgi:4-hydroxybenzoyl-CoA reductase subunit beta